MSKSKQKPTDKVNAVHSVLDRFEQQEKFVRSMNEFRTAIVLSAFVATLAIIAVFLGATTVEAEAEFTCTADYVGLDYEAINNIQNKTCEHDANYTCFKEDLQVNHIKIKNLEGLNCYGKGNTKLPLIALSFT